MGIAGINQIDNTPNAEDIKAKQDKSSLVQGSDFQNLMDKLTGGKIAAEIREKYNVTLNIGNEYNYEQILKNNDIRCVNYVQISAETLKKMENNPSLKKKIFDEIATFSSPEMIAETKALSPPVKSSGLIIYPDGSSSAWVEGYSNDLKADDNKKKHIILSGQSVSQLQSEYLLLDENAFLQSVVNMAPLSFQKMKDLA